MLVLAKFLSLAYQLQHSIDFAMIQPINTRYAKCNGEVSIRFRPAEKKADIRLFSDGIDLSRRPIAMAVIEIIDFVRQKILYRMRLNHTNQCDIDLQMLAKGIYLLKVTDYCGIEHFSEIVAN